MSFLENLFKRPVGVDERKRQDNDKVNADNQQVLAGMETLAKKVGNKEGLSMEEYLNNLRKEGSGM